MNARREIISFWVGLGPSVIGESERSDKTEKESTGTK